MDGKYAPDRGFWQMAAEILDYLNEAGYEGVNYVPQRPSLRVRLHNWLIRLGEADDADKCP